MSNPANVLGAAEFDGAYRQKVQDALDLLYGLIQKSQGAGAGATTFDELRVRKLTVVDTIDVVPQDKPPANALANLVTPWLTSQRGRPLVLRFEDQGDGGDKLEFRLQPYPLSTPTDVTGDYELAAYAAQRAEDAYERIGSIRFGHDGRIRTYAASELLVWDSSAVVAAFPPRYVSGLVIRYASASTVTVSAGKARDKADTADMTLSSQVTVSTSTANAALGYERKTLSGTHTFTNGTGTVTGSGSAYLTEFGTRPLTGTFSNSGPTVTGVGTSFLSAVAVNDLIGNSSNGYYRVVSIESDTSLTLVNTPSSLGGTDFTAGSTGNVIEQPVIETAGGRAHGLAVIYSNTSASVNYALTATETSVAAYASSKGAMNSSLDTARWRAVWLLSGGSGTTVALSTQRTTPYLSITGYTTSYRRIGWVRINSSGNLFAQYGADGGNVRWVNYESAFGDFQGTANASSTTTYQDCVLSSGAPPTALRVQIMLLQLSPNTVDYVMVRGRGLGSTGTRTRSVLAPSTSTESRMVFDTPCDGAQVIQHRSNASTTGDGTYIDLTAYEDTLE